jgi:hypothetical protein
MREILFRGKDFSGVINHNWCFGSLDTTENDRTIIIYFDRFGNKCRIFVDPSTIGEYTGLKDKNGKKVFEGDILKAEIWWEQGGCYPHTETCFIEATFPNMYKNHFEKFEVVGNIYDNPELLRSEE